MKKFLCLVLAVIVSVSAVIFLSGCHEHTFSAYHYNDDATCEEDGTETSYCIICGEEKHTRTKEGSALGHDFTDYHDNGNGTETATCNREGCNATDTRPIEN